METPAGPPCEKGRWKGETAGKPLIRRKRGRAAAPEKEPLLLRRRPETIEGWTGMKYICPYCGYTYDEELGVPESEIAPGTKWEDLPEGWSCPMCGAPKEVFAAQ